VHRLHHVVAHVVAGRRRVKSPPHSIAAEIARSAVARLAALGAEVRIFAGADNCVRCREEGEPSANPRLNATRLPFVVEVEGVPNLLHELAHVVLLGRVEKDHATEYSKIPFDLTSERGRELLFDELACCATSCAWHPGSDADARAWFAEQVGIQHCFFGFPDDATGRVRFLAAADAAVRDHEAPLLATVARARAGLEAVLGPPRRAFDFVTEWRALVAQS
jgi:hypothetical protein